MSLLKQLECISIWLSLSYYTFKITIFVNLWNVSQFHENWYSVSNRLIQVQFNLNPFAEYVIHLRLRYLFVKTDQVCHVWCNI